MADDTYLLNNLAEQALTDAALWFPDNYADIVFTGLQLAADVGVYEQLLAMVTTGDTTVQEAIPELRRAIANVFSDILLISGQLKCELLPEYIAVREANQHRHERGI